MGNTTRLGMAVLSGVCLATPAVAAERGGCKELFVAPLEAALPRTKPGGAPWDVDSPADPQLTAVPTKRKGAKPVVIGPRMDDTASPRWNSVFVEPGQSGGWLRVGAGDSLDLTLTDQDGRKAEVVGRYTVAVPPDVARHGVAYAQARGADGSELSLRFSVTDGTRPCAGLEPPVTVETVLPSMLIRAKVDAAFFARIRQVLGCDQKPATAEECQAGSYAATFSDPNRDGVPDAQVMGGPFGADKRQVIGVAWGFDPATRKELFVGECEELALVQHTREASCFLGDMATLVSIDGAGGVRTAPKEEAKKLVASEPRTVATTEVKLYLGELFQQQRRFFERQERFTDNMEALGFSPRRGNWYMYLLDPRKPESMVSATSYELRDRPGPSSFETSGCPVTPATAPNGEKVGLGFAGAQKPRHFIAYAMSNLDDDEDMDCWSISSLDRSTKDGTPIPAGRPFHEQDDLEAPTGR
ncbi:MULTISPECIES: hypothetical protein [unclassified Corallococcus]|uniref:hypothetical protein n=1 Tax=unclassified Corallococcus TaxID=2685029 RepID=UPI001A8DC03F|nr:MULTISPECIES: hypothetical protein [unclassified Corallococcus]MBN9681672.1 hypothetical protein [Corallococcus sp. NCSPR001]WAS86756.1 hypothetical protein O0N60_07200 [Corallococcus sp. NCRR]